MKKIYAIIVGIILVTTQLQPIFALTDPIQTKTHAGKGIKVIKTIRNGVSLVDVDFSTRAKPKNTKDIKYRLNLLPRPSDKNYTDFVVVPAKGVIIPVIKIKKNDPTYNKALKWEILDNKGNDILTPYINDWILHYPGTSEVWEKWLGRLFSHTSERKRYNTPYATVGQAFVRLDPSRWDKSADQFYYYKKINNTWILYVYNVTKEKKIELQKSTKIIWGKKIKVDVISIEDQKILRGDNSKSQLAIITCVDFGTDQDRRMTIGTLIETQTFDLNGKEIGAPVSTVLSPKTWNWSVVSNWTTQVDTNSAQSNDNAEDSIALFKKILLQA